MDPPGKIYPKEPFKLDAKLKAFKDKWSQLSRSQRVGLVTFVLLALILPSTVLTSLVSKEDRTRAKEMPQTPPTPPDLTPTPTHGPDITPTVTVAISPTRTPTPTIIYNNTPVIANNILPTGVVNQRYRAMIRAYDRDTTDVITITIGPPPNILPPNLRMQNCRNYVLNERAVTDCLIDGIPTSSGSYLIQINATDNKGGNAQKSLTLTINP